MTGVQTCALRSLLLLALRLKQHGRRFLIARDDRALGHITLIEAGLWLGLVPLGTYWLSFWPAFYWTPHPVSPWHPLAWHQEMIGLQDSVVRLHPYRSEWYQWMGNWRAIWYLYKDVDGAQRGVMLIGNPFTMYAGLVALGWSLWAALRRQRYDALVFAALYIAALVL